jgi:hypothetical protein
LFLHLSIFFLFTPLFGVSGLGDFTPGGEFTPGPERLRHLTLEWPRQTLARFLFYEEYIRPGSAQARFARGQRPGFFPLSLDQYAGEKGETGASNAAEEDAASFLKEGIVPDEEEKRREITAGLTLEGEINLNLQLGGDFSLKRGGVPGAGSAGITEGLKYDLFERVLLQGNIQERFYVEFDYDSRRTEEGFLEEHNTYSVLYRGKDDEFVREASLGNKYQSIEGSRYIPIDQGNPDSFALRGVAGWNNFTLEGLFRYEVALEGSKRFQGFRKSVDLRLLDVDYVRGQYFMLPDTGIDESTLLIYASTLQAADITVTVGGNTKNFRLLTRGVDYDFDNTLGYLNLKEALALTAELIAYYTKGGTPVGNSALGRDAIIGEDGERTDFENNGTFGEYFVTDGRTYLYLKKEAFNSYWELRSVYALSEFEGQTVSDVTVELLYTENSGINVNYSGLPGESRIPADTYTIDAERALIKFEFNDDTGPPGRFYPRPFPGEEPYDSDLAPYPPFPTPPWQRNPFDPLNPIYGGLNYPTADSSINTLRVQYSYEATSFFLDLNLVPGSVTVTVNGAALDPSKYDVDSAMGVVTFDTGVIDSSSDIVMTYKHNPFGGGDKRLFGALGVTYDAGPLRVKNLSAFKTGFPGQEAPEAGAELPREFKNTTEFSLELDKRGEERGFYGSLNGGFAFSLANRNAFGSAVVADMEKDESIFELGIGEGNWVLATISSLLDPAPGLASRGSVLYKNYWKKTIFEGDVLQTLSFADPRVFAYSDKAGPYNVDDELVEVDNRSLVIDYELPAGSTNAFVTIVTPIAQENLSGYERFNMILEWQGVSNTDVELYVELLQSYNEDLNGNSALDGESTINDQGFAITPQPVGSDQTKIGSDRDGNSNGRLDSEDLNGNNLLDTVTVEPGVIVPTDPNGVNDYYPIATGNQTWQYLSVDVKSLIATNRSVFQYANALRITVRAANSPVPGPTDATGKIVIDKIWFSGSGVVNESTDFLSISDVSVDEDPEVRQNAFSKSFPGVYEELHGGAGYRSRTEYLEKTLKVKFDSTAVPLDGEAALARRYGTPADLSFYRVFKMYLYLPTSETIPADIDFKLIFESSLNQTLSTVSSIQSEDVLTGWNEISVELKSPYTVKLNGADVTTMASPPGSLQVLKRVSKVRFGFSTSVPVASGFTVWLDEWHVSGSEGTFDKAYFAEGSVGYTGAAVSVGGFPLVQDPILGAGIERKEGSFTEDPEYRSDRYYTDVNARLFKALDSRFSLSRENLTHFRNREVGLDTDASYETVSHDFILDLEKPYVPVLVHGYDRTMKSAGTIELTQPDFFFKQEDVVSDAIELGERYTLPFGLTQFYTFQRRWQLQNTVTGVGVPPVYFPPVAIAYLNQVNDVYFAYGWEKGNVSLALKRDETFTGSDVPDPGSWPRSYFDRMAKIFSAPGDALEDAALTTRADLLAVELNSPLREAVGIYASLTTGFTASNFQQAGSERDTLATSRLSVAVPFRPMGSETLELTPGLERTFTADYKRAGSGVHEAEIVLGTYGALFAPPFYYAHRKKEYQAVDLYGGDARILGTSSNTLETRTSLDALIQDTRWFVPTNLGLALYSETNRQGGIYSQLRGFSSSASKHINLAPSEKVYKKSLDLSFTYKNERNYATKAAANSCTLSTDLSLLTREWRGTKLAHTFTYERERQRLNDPDYYAFPEDALAETVAFRPPRDKIDSKVTFEYLWDFGIGSRSVLRRIWKNEPFGGRAKNTERATLENIYTFTDRERAGSYSNVPVRLTLEHLTSYRISDHVEFGMNLKTVTGIEERVLPASPEVSILASSGLEAGITVKIVF